MVVQDGCPGLLGGLRGQLHLDLAPLPALGLHLGRGTLCGSSRGTVTRGLGAAEQRSGRAGQSVFSRGWCIIHLGQEGGLTWRLASHPGDRVCDGGSSVLDMSNTRLWGKKGDAGANANTTSPKVALRTDTWGARELAPTPLAVLWTVPPLEEVTWTPGPVDPRSSEDDALPEGSSCPLQSGTRDG